MAVPGCEGCELNDGRLGIGLLSVQRVVGWMRVARDLISFLRTINTLIVSKN
jgi:hypothetical protein